MSKLDDEILAAAHEMAGDLYHLGFIDKRRMALYDELCLPPVPEFGAAQIKALRKRLRMSQSVLADVLGTSLSSVRQWEIGARNPGGASRRLLGILDRKGLEVVF